MKKTKTLHVKGMLYSQFRLTMLNIQEVFSYIPSIHTWCRGGRYYADIEVGL